MHKPFEVDPTYLSAHLDEMVEATISDLTSEFLLLPKGKGFIEYSDFRDACEVLKRHTSAFTNFNDNTVKQALRENSRVFGVLRAILGMTPPEWAELARSERGSDVSQNSARKLDRDCRSNPDYICQLTRSPKTLDRIDALVSVAVEYIARGAPSHVEDVVHRLAKFDTHEGLRSLQYAASENVPYAVLLYERFLGRPFAGHRDSVSELVGGVMENAVEDRMRSAGK